MTTTYVPSDWTRALHELTLRNAGRTVALDRPDTSNDLPESPRFALQAASYDRTEGHIEITLRLPEGKAPPYRLTIEKVNDVDVVAAANGRTLALRMSHQGGRTVLRFLN